MSDFAKIVADYNAVENRMAYTDEEMAFLDYLKKTGDDTTGDRYHRLMGYFEGRMNINPDA